MSFQTDRAADLRAETLEVSRSYDVVHPEGESSGLGRATNDLLVEARDHGRDSCPVGPIGQEALELR